MIIIDGKKVATQIQQQISHRILKLREKNTIPGLAVILVGNNPASKTYVENKEIACKKIGIFSKKILLPESTTESFLKETIEELNNDVSIHGILLQLPLPNHLNQRIFTECISHRKDVDGLHSTNIAKLTFGDLSCLIPCTPLGCVRLLSEYHFPISGTHVVIVGRSMLVGKPLALLLISKLYNATVTIAHSESLNLSQITNSADILITAMGKPNFITKEYVRPGSIVLDVGISRVEVDNQLFQLVGDVDFKSVAPLTKAITPVPGGIGPMTIALLMENTVLACERIVGII